MLYGSQRPSCYREGRADGAPPTRNKPSFTLDAAEGGARVRPILVPVSPWSRRMSVLWNRAGARPKRHLIILMQTLIPQPSAVAPPLVPHLTGHVTGQMACQRAVTGHVTGYVRRDRFHALTPTRNKPSFTPRPSEGPEESASYMPEASTSASRLQRRTRTSASTPPAPHTHQRQHASSAWYSGGPSETVSCSHLSHSLLHPHFCTTQ